MDNLRIAENAPLLVLPDDGETAENLFRSGNGAFSVLSVPPGDWDRNLTPWEAPSLGGKRPPFAGEGRSFLETVLEETAQAKLLCGAVPVGILGYSLGGLFALWAACESGVFNLAGSGSGSLWYEGWCDYLSTHPTHARRVCLSLGDKEPKARNPRMARVGDCTEITAGLLKQQGSEVTFRWEQGGHFNDPQSRLLRLAMELTKGFSA